MEKKQNARTNQARGLVSETRKNNQGKVEFVFYCILIICCVFNENETKEICL